ncbi:MAG TPA: GH3 auxin-responsive promoter family protein, partial [Candidatus Acidoferrales bacterium]|nr:GH3 auxin-responsive promoter family protein [Candidatus Acidoferrales bacterium]
LAHELRKDEIYEVVLTTSGGLWRYRLQDLVQVTGFVGNTPSLHFLGRAGNVSDRYGEKLSENFVAQVILETTANLPSQPRFVLLAPDENQSGCCYTLYVEGEVQEETKERLEKLLSENVHYAWCRKLGQLQPSRTFRIENGGYETFIAQQRLAGKRIGEIKPCALSTESGWTKHFCGSYLPH